MWCVEDDMENDFDCDENGMREHMEDLRIEYKSLNRQIDALRAELARVTQERDAAIADMKLAAIETICAVCVHAPEDWDSKICLECDEVSAEKNNEGNFVWRGIAEKEND